MRLNKCRDIRIGNPVYDCSIIKHVFLYWQSISHFLFPYHLSDLALSEENAGQRLLDMENHKKQRALEHDNVEKQLRQYTAKNQMVDSELQYPLSMFFFTLCVHHGVGHKEIQSMCMFLEESCTKFSEHFYLVNPKGIPKSW